MTMKMAKEQEHPAKAAGEKKGKKSRGAAAFELDEEDEKLFEILRGLRAELAKKEGVPPYIVFSDKSLVHMCVIRPVNGMRCFRYPEWANLSMRSMGKCSWRR